MGSQTRPTRFDESFSENENMDDMGCRFVKLNLMIVGKAMIVVYSMPPCALQCVKV